MAKERRPRNALSIGRESEPHINEMDRPGHDWIPIRSAPAIFQATHRPFRKQTAGSEAILAFAKNILEEPTFIGFSEEGSILLLGLCGKGSGFDSIAPYSPHQAVDSINGQIISVKEDFAARIDKLWEKMEARFRTAHRVGNCRVMARCGSPIAEHFTSLAPDVFDAFKIIDWRNGVAVSVAGDRLYSIYAACPSEHDQNILDLISEFENSPLKVRVGQYFYRHHREGLVGDKITNALIKNIRSDIVGVNAEGKLDEKTIRHAYKLFRELLSHRPSAEMLSRISFVPENTI